MNTIAGIIDMDGFTIEKKFRCKELGLLDIEKEEGLSYVFEINANWKTLSEKDRRHCRFLTKAIHKLPYVTNGNTLPAEDLPTIVLEFYQSIKTNPESTLGYKGGHFERDLLGMLGIPSVNLEQFGCPKANTLFTNLIWLETCGHHIRKDPYLHCPKVEVEAFGKWVRENRSLLPSQ